MVIISSRRELLADTKQLIKDYAINPQKNLGQNFCIEPALLEHFKEKIQLINPRRILEIGGGLGTLSKVIIDLNYPIDIIEKDHNLVFLLERLLRNINGKIITGNALKFDEFQNYDLIIGNIPYEISSPLLFNIWRSNKFNDTKNEVVLPNIIFTVQKEFGLRIVANFGTQTYSRLSVMSQLFSNPQILKIFPPSAFYPKPQIAHAIVWFKPEINLAHEILEENFTKFLTYLFNRKNKKAKSSLKSFFKRSENRKKIENHFKVNSLFDKRVRDFSPGECVKAYQVWKKFML